MSTPKQTNNSEIMRHSLSHLMAAAILEMFPDAKFGIGPAIENGFYYDFDLPKPLTPEDLPKIEKIISRLIKRNLKFEKKVLPIKEVIATFKKLGQDYKVELLEDLKKEGEKEVSVYQSGDFLDLCRGPHLASSGKVGAFKLTHLAGAYWKGDEKNKMLTRIYGLAFATQKELDDYLKILAEAEKRDHKKIGKDLDLYSFHPEAPGSPFWHPRGMIIWNELERLGKSIRKKYGYKEIQTPSLAKSVLWEISGHWEHYKESMFHFKVEGDTYAIKPMDCPFNIKIYQESPRSYRELPIRYTEIGRVMRNEKSGELNGLLRVRHITQDDSHIFLTKEQVEKEIIILIKMAREYYHAFSLEPKFFFATRPDDFIGEVKDWQVAEKSLENALKKEKINYQLKEKDGAFYGPKIDIDIKDAIGRSWQLATIQLDFQLPQRFKLEYIDKDGKKKMPVMIHAAIFGSFERFIGIITEHYAGAFPTWLSPVQIKIIPVGKDHLEYSQKLAEEFLANDFRVEVDNLNETVGYKIRKAEKQKAPYMLVVGDKEIKGKTLNVRHRDQKEVVKMTVKKFIERIKKEIKEKK